MDSAPINGLIYQAVYIGIFIVATTITINLFTTINSYTEDVSDVVKGDNLSEVVSENEAVDVEKLKEELGKYTMSGYEVYSLVNNYGMMTNSGYYYGKKYNLGKIEVPSGDFVDSGALGAEQENKIDLNLGYKIYVYDKTNNIVEKIENIKLNAQYKVDKTGINKKIWKLNEVDK